MRKLVLLLCCITLATSIKLSSQSPDSTASIKNHPEQHEFSSMLSPTLAVQEYNLSIGLLIFSGFTILIMATVTLKRNVIASDFFKYVCVIIVINGSLFLLTAGYNKEQIAPVIGLLGTVIGFIIGKSKTE